MKIRTIVFSGYFALLTILGLFSYGFIDPNITLSKHPLFVALSTPLTILAYQNRQLAVCIFLSILCLLYFLYVYVLRHAEKLFISWKAIMGLLIGISMLLVLSYPALSYDLFNYITTAKVFFETDAETVPPCSLIFAFASSRDKLFKVPVNTNVFPKSFCFSP